MTNNHLTELVKNTKPSPAPTKSVYCGEWIAFDFAVGKDETATLMMTKEAYELITQDNK